VHVVSPPPLSTGRCRSVRFPRRRAGLHLPLAGNPRPFGMPPFAHVLDEADTAAVVSYVRGAWGNGAAPVTPLEVLRWRPGALR